MAAHFKRGHDSVHDIQNVQLYLKSSMKSHNMIWGDLCTKLHEIVNTVEI